jgi:hypothetical protein
MMDEERLDNDLSNRISEVFDNYEDTGADEGWDLLRQKYPPKEKDRGLTWLWYAAAAVVLLGLGVWLIQKPGKPNQLMVKQPKPVIKLSPAVKQPANINRDTLQNNIQPNNMASRAPKTKIPITAPVQNHPFNVPATSVQQAVTSTTLATHTVKQTPNTTAPLVQPGNNTPPVPFVNKMNGATLAGIVNPTVKTPVVAPVQNNVTNQQISPSFKTNGGSFAGMINQNPLAIKDSASKQSLVITSGAKNSIAKNNPVIVNQAAPNKTLDSIQKTAGQFAHNQKAFNSLFEGEKSSVMKEDKTTLKERKKAMLSLYAATYFNYAKGSTNQMNVGAGFTSDFKISNKLRLSTGVFVGQNTLNYNGISGQSGNLYFASVASQSAPVSFNESNLVTASNNKAITPTKLYNANLIGLDVPVNLKYQFNPQNDTYVSAGLSSGTFINETYQSGYVNSTTVQSTTHSSFSNFDLAKTLNVSFGVGYPLGKSNRLIVEPFLKYPLDGLGSQQLKFGAGGVNLKLNFQTSKK